MIVSFYLTNKRHIIFLAPSACFSAFESIAPLINLYLISVMEVAACVENFTFPEVFPCYQILICFCSKRKLALASTFLFAKSSNEFYIKKLRFFTSVALEINDSASVNMVTAS
jgi:hypothetical protein